MTDRVRFVAPAGAPIRPMDLLRAAGGALSGRDVASRLRDGIRRSFAVRHVYLTSTGRAGMTILLRALRSLGAGASVKNAAIEAGYQSPSAFVAAFRSIFGTTPGRYFT